MSLMLSFCCAAQAQQMPCEQNGNYSVFVAQLSEPLAGLPNLKLVMGTRYTCSGPFIISSTQNQFEVRDIANDCSTVIGGQIFSGSGTGKPEILRASASNLLVVEYAPIDSPITQALSHLSYYCRSISISPRLKLFSNGNIIPNLKVTDHNTCI